MSDVRKWEYMEEWDLNVTRMNTLGEDRWELIAVTHCATKITGPYGHDGDESYDIRGTDGDESYDIRGTILYTFKRPLVE